MLTKKRIILLAILIFVCVITPVMGTCRKETAEAGQSMQVITIWQIDGFEGGKGSRAQFLQNKADSLFRKSKTYAVVTAISAEAARANLKGGNVPDIISYQAGFYGLDGFINAVNFAYKTWCRGGYCLLCVDGNGDFSDASPQNTVINTGKENLYKAAALLTGLNGAAELSGASAYVQLINGKYKYLLGTQRDVYRLITRGVSYQIKAITQFNDLYQNVSILSKDAAKYSACKTFVEYLVKECDDYDKIGLFKDGATLYSDSLRQMENLTFECALKSFVSESFFAQINTAAENGDINMLKTLLK